MRVFQLYNEQAVLVQTHRLMSKTETNAEEGLGLGGGGSRIHIASEVNFKNDEIKEIYITQNELIAVITFSSGAVSLYDCKNAF